MGVIKDGKVSGTIPNNEVFAVHYPGYPSSMSRAIQTLGGHDAILKTRSSQDNKLELYFRPEDPYSHPALGDLRTSNSLLLKISKKKITSSLNSPNFVNDKPEMESEVQEELCADIVARIPEAYHFERIVDFQHVVAVHADAARRKRMDCIEMEEPSFEKAGLMDPDQEDMLILVPPSFSSKDSPANLALRPPPISSSKTKEAAAIENHFGMDLEPALAIDFNIKEIPKEINWKAFILEGSELWGWQMVVSKLFEERPIWPKGALTDRLLDKNLKFTHQTLRRLLLAVAYYFQGGPFFRFWIRKGYDPRKDPDSRIYQRIDFRVPHPLRIYSDSNNSNCLTHKWGDLCKFQVFPCKFQVDLQLCELDDDYIQQEIKKPPSQTVCTRATGWFSQDMHDSLKYRVMMRFLSVYPKSGAAKFLKTASEDFEKSKRACIYRSILKPDQPEHQQVNKEVDGETNEKQNNIDEAEDMEADEPEEELDAYEATYMADEDDETFLQAHSFMENNSRSYLQELFDSFPQTEAGADKITQDADSSEEEYQIYEQDDDDSDYDD